MNKEDYQKYVEEKSPNSPIIMDCLKAFLVGGLLCALGQIIFEFFESKDIRHGMLKKNYAMLLFPFP